jgi:hypothetical protein
MNDLHIIGLCLLGALALVFLIPVVAGLIMGDRWK